MTHVHYYCPFSILRILVRALVCFVRQVLLWLQIVHHRLQYQLSYSNRQLFFGLRPYLTKNTASLSYKAQ